MKYVWCWRCKRWVVALDEQEHARLVSQYVALKRAYDCEEKVCVDQRLYAAVVESYESLTGERGIGLPEVLLHHVAEYGPPCTQCRKNLRTPTARQCFECGWDGHGD